MKEFMLIFRNISGQDGYVTTAQDMAEDMPAWQAWIGNIAMQGKLIATQPMEYHGWIVSRAGIAPGPDKGGNNVLVAGFLLCKADSVEEVQLWSQSCPILKYPHGSVEVRPLITFPID
jgi:hypothetical protein